MYGVYKEVQYIAVEVYRSRLKVEKTRRRKCEVTVMVMGVV